MNQLSITHSEVDVRYRERDNLWVFELRGRERTAASLAEAKEVINKAPKEQKKAERFEAYLINLFGEGVHRVTVGAYAEKQGYSSAGFWVSNNGSRSKEDPSHLVKDTPGNAAIIAEINQLTEQINALKLQRSESVAALERIAVPAREAETVT